MDNQGDGSQYSDKEQYIDELDWLDDHLSRAIRGIFVFAFQKLPAWMGLTLASILSTTFGLLWKLIRGITNFLRASLIWLFWTLPQKLFSWFVNSATYLLRLGKVLLQALTLATIAFGPLLLSLQTGQFTIVSGAWCLFAIVAAVWGLIYLNRGKWRVGQAIRRFGNKLKFWRRNSTVEFVEK